MISYKPFLKTILDRGLKKQDILDAGIVSKGTISRMKDRKKNEYISLEVIEKLCNYLNCNVQDIIEYIPDEEKQIVK